MTKFLTAPCLTLLLVCPAARGQVTAVQTPDDGQARPAPEIVRLDVTPAPVPRGAFQIEFLPPYLERTPGNAAPLYYRAVVAWTLTPKEARAQFQEQWERLREAPIEDFPVEEAREALRPLESIFATLEEAARRERCDWELRIREIPGTESIFLLLSEFQELRSLARMLELKLRMEIAQGRLDNAVRTLQTGLSLARDTSEPPTFVNALIGTAICHMMLQQVDALLQRPETPNLYWALTTLPDPLISLRHSGEQERNWPLQMFRALREAHEPRSPEEWRALLREIDEFVQLQGLSGGGEAPAWQRELALTALLMKGYPQAKWRLIQQGHDPREIDELPVGQVVALSLRDQYDHVSGETYKWLHVPYREGRDRIRGTTERLKEQGYLGAEGGLLNLAALLLPAIDVAMQVEPRLQRRVAELRTIEALRMYAAGHGNWPESLQQIEAVPLPEDPFTGEPFTYRRDDGAATLNVEIPEELADRVKRYALTLRK